MNLPKDDGVALNAASDRTVHAKLRNGIEIVRYERSGKWYQESCDEYGELQRIRLGVNHAAQTAVMGFVYFNRPGGLVFERKVRALRAQEARDVRA